MKSRLLRIVARLLCASSFAWMANGNAENVNESINSIKRDVQSVFPGVKIDGVAKLPDEDIYEIYLDSGIVYSTRSGKKIFTGDLIDIRSKANLTQKRLDELSPINFEDLPFTYAFSEVKGSGARSIAVFVDPDCTHCMKLERELDLLSDVTIYTFVRPGVAAHSQAATRSILCSKDPAKAWQTWVNKHELDSGLTNCEGAPLDKLASLAGKLRLRGVPTIFFEDGTRLTGETDASAITSILDRINRQLKR